MHQLEAFKELLGKPQKIIITTHHKPDADALGSSLGLGNALKKMGHVVNVISPTDYPSFLNWMKGSEDVIIFENKGQQEISEKLIQEASLIFCLDFSSLHRINEVGELVREAPSTKVLIDHHLEPEHFADYEFHDTTAAATAELVFELLDGMGLRELITPDVADCLYAGIMTDTGQFKHGNTTKKVHVITGELIDLGADVSQVAQNIYDSNSLNRIKFLGYALSEKLILIPECKTAYFTITAEELNRFNSQTGDTEGLVNFALSIKGVVFAALIVDRTVAVKMSFRSRGTFSVNEFARRYFNGGGHKNAAGGRSDVTLEETVQQFVKAVEENKKLILTQENNEKIHA